MNVLTGHLTGYHNPKTEHCTLNILDRSK